jgi:hypothetical protein
MQGPWTLDRQPPDSDSQFAEGWMDLAAWKAFEHILYHQRPCMRLSLAPYGYRAEFFESAGRQMCAARHAEPVDTVDLGAARRYTGWKAANNTLESIQKARINDAESVFLRLSFAINASDISPTRRDTIAHALSAALTPSNTPRQARRVAVVAAIRRFGDDGDLDALVTSVMADALPRRRGYGP